MNIVGMYSFNNGKEAIEAKFNAEFQEVQQAIEAVRGKSHKTKTSREKTMPGKALYSPKSLNIAFEAEFEKRGWRNQRVLCDYSTQYYTSGYAPSAKTRGAFRDIDFVKNKVGVEIQFGKYSFMVYNVCAKMTIFHKMGLIDVGIEVVPLKELANEMSTGVSYFEQIVWDLEHRGVADIDIPVLILGIAV